MWFELFCLHLQQISFSNPLEFLAFVLQANNKLAVPLVNHDAFHITTIVAIILKQVWKARCDAVFNNILVGVARILMLAENDLKLELSYVSLITSNQVASHPYCWIKLSVNVGFKDGSIAIAILAWDEIGKVQGLCMV